MSPPERAECARSGTPAILEPPFCREAELQDIISVIRTEECRAVFLTSENGLGATSILRELSIEAGKYVPVVFIHGSLSLSNVPYGVLASLMTRAGKGHINAATNVLHALLAEVERLRELLPLSVQPTADPPLIIIDDAHYIDSSTSKLLVDLVMSGTMNVVASHVSRKIMPEPLPKLWSTGMAENIILEPLSLEQGRQFCDTVLGGPVLAATSRHFWSASAGNPLLLRIMLGDAARNGQLALRRGRWVLAHGNFAHGRELSESVRTQLRGLSDAGKSALNLIALAEPIDAPVVKELLGAVAVNELREWNLVQHRHPDSELLSLVNPVYGEMIRELVPIGQSRHLHEQLVTRLGWEALDSHALLRRVLWALEIGVDVDDKLILQAATYAGRLYESAISLRLADAIGGKEYQLRANMVRARAKYDLGDYTGAFAYMQTMPEDAQNLEDLLFGTLLRASTRSALGMPVQAIEDDADALRKAGERLALENPDQGDHILEHSRKSALLLTLMELSREGRYSDMAPLAMVLARANKLGTASEKLYRAVALAMDAERLTAQGYPLQALVRAQESFAIEHSEQDDVFFLPETILLRHVAATLCAGDWAAAEGVLQHFSVEAGPVVFSFGGGVSVVRGMAFLRCGLNSEALEALLPGIDALRSSDPQQLLGYCTAMAAYAAACLGRHGMATQLMEEYVESTGMFVVLAHERAYFCAARHLLQPEGPGLAELLAQANAAGADGSSMLELNALVLTLELGDDSVAARVGAVAAGVEGPWARSVGAYAQALLTGENQALVEAESLLSGAGLLGLARQARSKISLVTAGAKKSLKHRSKTPPASAAQLEARAKFAVNAQLTRREREVTTLAAAACSDREIAEKLNVSLRTVEGHLYRAYAKLGVSSREELALAIEVLEIQK
ncbi:LuxR C-terminal-related transcriptional regulator [Arthrobacter sp. TMP15]|uniref:helix-turn-helix transcriptional regulator n=1 Tax=Arthrobacter sp. TMP15 TaxID=3140789 RepID=UPI0031BAB958